MTLTATPATTATRTVDSNAFRAVLRRQASTVTVVTAGGAAPAGFTATSFTSVSLEPLLVSFCLSRASSSWPAVAQSGHVAVHLLAHHQRGLARTFATSGIDRFAAPTRWRLGPYDVPILEDTLAYLLCRVVQRVPAGDHTVVLAQPLLYETGVDESPLLYHDGNFTNLAATFPGEPQ